MSGQVAYSNFSNDEQNQFSRETASIFLYRLGIGELKFSPYNIGVSESININQEINESLYAKTNPIVHYTNTTRKFSLNFTLTNDTIFIFDGERELLNQPSQKNLIQLMNIFKSFLYANYDRLKGTDDTIYARTIKSPPIFKLRFQNYISNGDEGLPKISGYNVAKDTGLLGVISNFKIDPTFNPIYRPASNQFPYYSQIKIAFDFIPMFEEPVGWEIGQGSKSFSNTKELGGPSSKNVIKTILGN